MKIKLTAPPFTLPNASSYCSIPTYDGSGILLHPDIIFFPTGFKGGLSDIYNYIMAYTPYPNSNNDYENPSIVVGKTPTQFTFDNISNPVVPPLPSGQFHSDSDIIYKDGTFYLYYRLCDEPVTYTKVYRRKSTDLISWSDAELCNIPLTGAEPVVSPAIIFDGKWKMWCVNMEAGYQVAYLESDDGLNWTLIGYTDIPVALTIGGGTRKIWHIDVNKTRLSGKYYGLFAYGTENGTPPYNAPIYLIWAESDDGLNWTVYDQPVLSPSGVGWDSAVLYRSTFFIYNRKVCVFYSGDNSPSGGTWHVGYTEAEVDFVNSEDATLNVCGLPEAPTPEIVGLTELIGGTLATLILAEFLRKLHRERRRKT